MLGPQEDTEASSVEPTHEAFPSTVDPPWKRRKNLLTTVVVPGTLVGAGLVTLILVLRPPGSNRDEEQEQSVQAHQDPTEPQEGNGERSSARDATGDVDPSDLSGTDDIWGEEDDLDEIDAAVAEPTPNDTVAAKAEGRGASNSETDRSEGNVVFEGVIGAGTTVTGKLSSHGLNRSEAAAVVAALDGLYDFRRSRPGDRYRLVLGGTERGIQVFRYETGPTEIYEVSRRRGELVGRRVAVKTTIKRVRVGRRVVGSLASTISSSGLKSRVLRVFLNTFGSDINFQNAQREGDVFRVIADEERLDGEFLGYEAIRAIEYSGERVTKRRAFYFKAPGGRASFFNERGESLERTKFRTPCNYRRISSPFDPNRLHPVLKRRTPHNGVDFAAPRGTPVWATTEGTVGFVGRKGASGNLVILRHPGNLESIYAHLQRFARGLKRRQEVRQGQVIGYVGSTGRSTGPHLHFGLRRKGRFIDPMKHRAGPARMIEPQHKAKFIRLSRRLAKELDSIVVR